MKKLPKNSWIFIVLLGLMLTSNTCYERTYIEIVNTQSEPVICIIDIYDTQSNITQVFLEDTLSPKSSNGFFDLIYAGKDCAKSREITYSDFSITSMDLTCPYALVDRAYFYRKLKKMSRETEKEAIILLEAINGDTLFFKSFPLDEFLARQSEKSWIAI